MDLGEMPGDREAVGQELGGELPHPVVLSDMTLGAATKLDLEMSLHEHQASINSFYSPTRWGRGL